MFHLVVCGAGGVCVFARVVEWGGDEDAMFLHVWGKVCRVMPAM